MAMGLLGKKIGMTQVFGPEGGRFPVTVLEVGPCAVVRLKSEAGPDGYDAVVLGWGKGRRKRMNKPQAGLFEKAGIEPVAFLHEARVSADQVAALEVGQSLDAALFSPGQRVDVVGRTKGRGYTGVIKRHNFAQPKMSHGTHEKFRHGGSLGSATTPGRVVLGRKMAGRYGNERVTVPNLLVVGVEADRNLVVVKGSVPGPNGRLIWIQNGAKQG